MAKLYKVEMYIIDFNDEIMDVDDLKGMLEEFGFHNWIGIKIANIKESKEFEWSDDLKINKVDATVEDFEKYFKPTNNLDELLDQITEDNKHEEQITDRQGKELI